MARQTHYTILKIAEDADPARIRHAFRTLVRRYHPDAGVGSSAEKFHAVVEAYGVLSDPQMRRDYDAALAQSRSRNVNAAAAEPLIPPGRQAESIYMSPRYVAAYDPFAALDHVLDEMFGMLNSSFIFRGW
jgi:DnaJ-class molecular chaperone